MNNDTAIKLENVSKKYCKSLKKSMLYGVQDIGRNMLGLSSNSQKLRSNEFWAVKDISFELKKGEALGLIGPNGSGKSTLLKMLNGIFWPDRGKVMIRGKVGALIEVGAGFHPLLTGRENIYVNGAIMGMSKKDIDDKFEDIIKFADIGDFIDTPVKSYSSGMFVRLGFAVAVHSEPDVLLIDEVLAVGDRDFQLKCFKRIHELKSDENTTIVLVSHNEYAMRQYTQKSIVLNNGHALFYGNSEEAISFYINKLVSGRKSEINTQFYNKSGNIITKVVFKDFKKNITGKILTGEGIIIDLHYETQKIIRNPVIGVSFYNFNGLFTGFWNSYENIRLPDISGKGIVRIVAERFDLPVDNYRCVVVVCEEVESNLLEWRDLEQRLTVERPINTRGFLKLPHKWEVIT